MNIIPFPGSLHDSERRDRTNAERVTDLLDIAREVASGDFGDDEREYLAWTRAKITVEALESSSSDIKAHRVLMVVRSLFGSEKQIEGHYGTANVLHDALEHEFSDKDRRAIINEMLRQSSMVGAKASTARSDSARSATIDALDNLDGPSAEVAVALVVGLKAACEGDGDKLRRAILAAMKHGFTDANDVAKVSSGCTAYLADWAKTGMKPASAEKAGPKPKRKSA